MARVHLFFALLSLVVPYVDSFADDCPADKFALWNGGYLRGANIFQGRNPGGAQNGFGDGDFQQSDFDDLAQAGANYVHISHAGIFTENPPYVEVAAAIANLDQVIAQATAAGLYIGIAFRSGPGRSESAITNRADPNLNEAIWSDLAAHNAWVDMLSATALRYRGNPNIVGYSIMVEPNAYAHLGFPGPAEFYNQYAATLADVNGLFADATQAIRAVDTDIPILLEPEGFGGLAFLPYLANTGDARTVGTPHDYTPFQYTHEEVPGSSYPGSYDVDSDGNSEFVDSAFLQNFISAASTFHTNNNVPVAFTEFGVHRTALNASLYLNDRIAIQNTIGSWAVWVWQPAGFDDPFSVHDPSRVLDVLKAAWINNCKKGGGENQGTGIIHGRTYTLSRSGRIGDPIGGVTVQLSGRTTTSSRLRPRGSYSFEIDPGNYTLTATYKRHSCLIGSSRTRKTRRLTLFAGETLGVRIFCRK